MSQHHADHADYQIDAALGGLALASALKRLLPEESWSQVKRLIATRRVAVNGIVATDPAAPVRRDDRVAVFVRSRPKPITEADVKIVYVDEHLVVVDKPPRIIAVKPPGEQAAPHAPGSQVAHTWIGQTPSPPTLDEMLQRMLLRRPESPPDLLVRAVHRLDRDTSGLMLFALSAQAQQRLTQLFRAHAIERSYLAIVHGHPVSQRIETWLVRDRGDGLRGSAPAGPLDPTARRAVTFVEPLEPIGPFSLVRCRLETGRTHQIRIHLMEIGHMICGDRTYTNRLGEPPRQEPDRAPRQALHSAELRFTHPMNGAPLHFQSPLPPDLERWLSNIRAQLDA